MENRTRDIGAWIGFAGSIVGAVVGGVFAIWAGSESEAAKLAKQEAQNTKDRVAEIRTELDELVLALNTPVTAPQYVPIVANEWRTCEKTTLVTTTVTYPHADGNAHFDCYLRQNQESEAMRLPPIHGGPGENNYPSTTFYVPAGWQYKITGNIDKTPSPTARALAVESYFRIQ